MMSLKSGTQLGGWTVDHVLAFGEPALVAAHRTDDPNVRATLRVAQRRGQARAWMNREMVALQSFDDPNIPRPIESGSTEDALFIALRPFSGDSISDRLVAGHRDWKQTCAWLYQLARTLRHVHTKGWVHRAINPQSVYIGGPDEVRLMGFEFALRKDEHVELSTTYVRNMAYVAPEVLREPNYHAPRADLYSFGLVAYEMLCGEPAFPAAAWAERADRERTLLEWKTRASALDPGPDVPEWLRSLVLKCTHPLSEQRLPDMDSVVAWLEASRPSWETVRPPEGTPMAVPREQLPRLDPQPTFDVRQLADVIAAAQQSRHQTDMLYVTMSGLVGGVTGLVFAALTVLFVELSRV